MKKVPIDVRRPLPKRILKDAEKEPVFLTVSGKPRFVVRSVNVNTLKARSDRDIAAAENAEWREFASRHILSAYAESDAIYDEL